MKRGKAEEEQEEGRGQILAFLSLSARVQVGGAIGGGGGG